MNLNGTWKLKDFDPGDGIRQRAFTNDFDDSAWLPARVPGNVHTALGEAKRIEPPFFGMNVDACQWVEHREWWYRTTFEYGGGKSNSRDWLVFDGLDTLCTIYLNGDELGRHENMFTPAHFDVTDTLRVRSGKNQVALRFDPIVSSIGDRKIPGDWKQRAPERVWVRKAQYNFGWDWAPRLVTVGPWQGIHLDSVPRIHITSVYFHTHLISAQHDLAEVTIDVDVVGEANVEVTLSRDEKRYQAFTRVADNGRARVALIIPDPELWWTHDLGTPSLYDLQVTLRSDNQIVDTFSEHVGIRSITWDQSPDPQESGARFFTPVLNGAPIFAKGANWVPTDSFLSEVDEARYRDLLELAVEGRMNMLRVWGGGIYEKDIFYRLCDEFGILVWQDFMYACGLYPDFEPEFLHEAEREAREAIKRLRNHPCIALWCGNNENDWIADMTFWSKPGCDFPGKRIYHELLPRVLNELDPVRFYWQASPYGGNDHNDTAMGDHHNWQTWHGSIYPRRFGQLPDRSFTPEGVSYRHYADDLARFVSEFGMHAAPVVETLRRNVPHEALAFGTDEMLYRNKDNPKDKGNCLMQAHTGLPKNLQEYIDFSMIAQAEGLKFGIEHYRRRKPHCSGTLIWQLNDCWPGLSWSVIDYYHFAKAGYFYGKRAFAPIIATFKQTKDRVQLWIVNDTLVEYQDTITFRHATFTGELLYDKELRVSLPPNSARVIAQINNPSGYSPSNEYLHVYSHANIFPDNRLFLAEIKDLRLSELHFHVEKKVISDSEIEIVLSNEQFVYFCKLECPLDGTRFSDNYFDLFPNRPRIVRVRHIAGHALGPDDVTVSSLS